MTRVLVCGGRDYCDVTTAFTALHAVRELCGCTVILQGGARGADALACDWALLNGIPCEEYAADWPKHGRAAGPIRNQRMLTEGKPDLVLAFPGGRGTADMIARARAQGVKVLLSSECAG